MWLMLLLTICTGSAKAELRLFTPNDLEWEIQGKERLSLIPSERGLEGSWPYMPGESALSRYSPANLKGIIPLHKSDFKNEKEENE